jgi:hypothetical protein
MTQSSFTSALSHTYVSSSHTYLVLSHIPFRTGPLIIVRTQKPYIQIYFEPELLQYTHLKMD